MKLIEIFNQLTHGELSQFDLGGGDVGVNLKDYPRLTHNVNLGLSALHERFLLKTGKVVVALQSEQSTYVLNSQFAASNNLSSEPVKYLLDTADPFKDDVIKVERIYDDLDPLCPRQMPLNQLDDINSIQTIDYRTLYIPAVEDTGLTRRVVYRKTHRLLGEDDWDDPEESEISLPYSHLNALLLFVASRLFTPLGGTRDGHEGNNYALKYEQACMLLERQGMQIDQNHDAPKFMSRGFA